MWRHGSAGNGWCIIYRVHCTHYFGLYNNSNYNSIVVISAISGTSENRILKIRSLLGTNFACCVLQRCLSVSIDVPNAGIVLISPPHIQSIECFICDVALIASPVHDDLVIATYNM